MLTRYIMVALCAPVLLASFCHLPPTSSRRSDGTAGWCRYKVKAQPVPDVSYPSAPYAEELSGPRPCCLEGKQEFWAMGEFVSLGNPSSVRHEGAHGVMPSRHFPC